MANKESTEFEAQVGPGATPLDPTDAHGRVRIGHFTFTGLTVLANDTLSLLKMPGGKIRVLRVTIVSDAFSTNAALDVGYGAYNDRSTKVDVVADADAFAQSLDIATGGKIQTPSDEVVDSASGWTLTGLVKTAGGSNKELRGFVEYVID